MPSIKRTDSTYKKKKTALGAIQNLQPTLDLSITDCMCPICLEILVEPVVLPCKHELCLPCFSGMTDKTNFLCPMCRMRISTWSRTASNSNTLVNKQRWEQIKKAFPNEVSDRLEGKSAAKLAASIEKENEIKNKFQTVSKPGEIHNEYQSFLKREQERLRLEKEQEEKLSFQYIEQIIEQEDQMTVSAYVNKINNTPNLRDHVSTRSTPTTAPATIQNIPQIAQDNTPILIRPISRANVPSISLNSQSRLNLLPNTPTINETPIEPTEQQDNSLPRRQLIRRSTRRTQDEKKEIRAKLLVSIIESNAADISESKRKRVNTDALTVPNENSFDDSGSSPRLKRPNRQDSIKKTSTLQRRTSIRLARQTNL